jgi:hypothetical protein
MIIHLAVELGVTQKAAVFDAVVLMSLNVRENPHEEKVAAIDHYSLEDIGVTALSWDLVWWQIFHLVHCTQAV